MNKLFIFVFSFLLYSQADAQLKQLSMDEAMLGARGALAPQNLRQLQFIKGTNDYVYLKKSGAADIWVKGSFTRPESAFLDFNAFNHEMTQVGLDTFKTWPALSFEKNAWIVSAGGAQYKVFPASHTYETLISKNIATKDHVERSNAGYVAYVENWNLFIGSKSGVQQVTTDGSENIVYASSVHREEFGIEKGTFWSSSGNLLAFYRMDQSMVADYPIIDWSVSPAQNHNIKYPMAGGSSHHVTVGVYNPQSKKLIYLNTGQPADQYLTNIAWSPDDKYVYIAVLNRAQNHMWLKQFDAVSGDFVKTLFEEEDAKYTEPLHPVLFLPNNKDQFIWQSRRDGWNHLYLYDIHGKLIRQLTSGNWEVLDIKQFDAAGKRLYFTSTIQSPISKNLEVLDIKSGKITPVTNDAYVHTC